MRNELEQLIKRAKDYKQHHYETAQNARLLDEAIEAAELALQQSDVSGQVCAFKCASCGNCSGSDEMQAICE